MKKAERNEEENVLEDYIVIPKSQKKEDHNVVEEIK
jgi:hypothetical protein